MVIDTIDFPFQAPHITLGDMLNEAHRRWHQMACNAAEKEGKEHPPIDGHTAVLAMGFPRTRMDIKHDQVRIDWRFDIESPVGEMPDPL